jgi:hypothetical protein
MHNQCTIKQYITIRHYFSHHPSKVKEVVATNLTSEALDRLGAANRVELCNLIEAVAKDSHVFIAYTLRKRAEEVKFGVDRVADVVCLYRVRAVLKAEHAVDQMPDRPAGRDADSALQFTSSAFARPPSAPIEQ